MEDSNQGTEGGFIAKKVDASDRSNLIDFDNWGSYIPNLSEIDFLSEPVKSLLQKVDIDIAAYIANREEIIQKADNGVLSRNNKARLKKAKNNLEQYLTEINTVLSKFPD